MQRVVLQKGKGHRVEGGHPWVYGNELESIQTAILDGEIVKVYNFKGQFVGRGYYNERSQIRVRLLTRNTDEQIDETFFRNRILQCAAYRRELGFTKNYRLVFGEGDGLPALIIDVFDGIHVLQTLSAGMDKWKQVIADILMKDLQAKGVYERNDVAVRSLEGLEEMTGFLSAPCPTDIIIEEEGVQFHVDIAEGQKTGFFLDQKMNRLALQHIVAGKSVLDCFTHTGSFALFAARFGADKIIAVDIAESAIALAEKNAQLNGINNIECICANAFDLLPVWVKENRTFDVVILDPPAFTKSRKNMENAYKGYKEINLRGMKLVKPGGFLFTFSCSHFMDVPTFYDMVSDAARDAGRTIREVQYLSQSPDHPVVWGIPETHYLKGLVLQVM